MAEDKYQKRYLKHQARKKRQLAFSEGTSSFKKYTSSDVKNLTDLLQRRRSQRVFIQKEISDDVMQSILRAATLAPNSCNRHGILLKVIDKQVEKDLLTGILVGGIGWTHRANKIILLLADPEAYKSPYEREFMHYCDAGFKAQYMWLMAEAYNVGVAYINPNIREENKELFDQRFGKGLIFCGALALGYYEKRALESERISVKELLV